MENEREKKLKRKLIQANLNPEEQELYYNNRAAAGFNSDSAYIKARVLGAPLVKRKADPSEEMIIRALDHCAKIVAGDLDSITKARLDFVIEALHAVAPRTNI